MQILVVSLLIGMALLASKLTDWVKLLLAGHVHDFITLTVQLLIGIATVLLGAASDFAKTIIVRSGDMSFSFASLNVASRVYLGLLLGATGSFAYDKWSRKTPSLGTRVPPETP